MSSDQIQHLIIIGVIAILVLSIYLALDSMGLQMPNLFGG